VYECISTSNDVETTLLCSKCQCELISLCLSLLINCVQVRLEVMGKKAKNATYISGNEAGKISREVAKVEKRRTVKSTLCNERSSRSHCMVGYSEQLHL
jgi:hypothetical protein